MKIKMLVSLAGADFSVSPGEEYECSEAEALRHIEAGNAVPVAEPKVERAVKIHKAAEKRG
jgi:hypothetical protein